MAANAREKALTLNGGEHLETLLLSRVTFARILAARGELETARSELEATLAQAPRAPHVAPTARFVLGEVELAAGHHGLARALFAEAAAEARSQGWMLLERKAQEPLGGGPPFTEPATSAGSS
jgi:hypothetical protein